MNATTFLRRIALTASAGRLTAGPAAPAGPLTLGRLVYRRRLRLARTPAPADGLASDQPQQLNEAWPEAGLDPAHQAPKSFSGYEPREVAGDSERADVSGKRLQGEVPEVSRLTHERIESGQPAVNAQRSVADTVAKDQSDIGQPAIDAAPADPPSHRPATLPASSEAPALLRARVERAAEDAATPEEDLEESEPAAARMLARAEAEEAPEELEEPQEEAPAVARALAFAAVTPPSGPPPSLSFAPAAFAQPPQRASEAAPATDGEAAAGDTPVPAGRSPADPRGDRRESPLPLASPFLVEPPAPGRVDASSPETVVHIGTIEVVIEAPIQPARSAPPAPAAGLASRFYLRGL